MRAIPALWMLAAVLSVPCAAEQTEDFGAYTIHYNALTTDAVEPAIARAYGIPQHRNRALINVAVLRKVMGVEGQPSRAAVSLTSTNASALVTSVQMRELHDGGAIFYLGELPVNDGETLKFTLMVKPEGAAEPHTIVFDQLFPAQAPAAQND